MAIKNRNDVSGQIFNRLKIMPAYKKGNNNILWLCKCECGNFVFTTYSKLKSGHTKSCGCYNRESINKGIAHEDITGQKFGRLIAIEYKKHSAWLCQCDCGNKTFAKITDLKRGYVISCGCFRKEMKKNETHGMSNTRFYNIWKGIKKRCYNINSSVYKHYGERGISVCDRWLIFDNFKEDMYESYLEHVDKFGERQTTIDRIDYNRDYELSNCRWADYNTQVYNRRPQHNQRLFIAFSPDGKEYINNNIKQFSEKHNLDPSTVGRCLSLKQQNHKGWRFEYFLDKENINELSD